MVFPFIFLVAFIIISRLIKHINFILNISFVFCIFDFTGFNSAKMLSSKKPYSNIQQELLQIYETNVSDDILIELKKTMAHFFLVKMRSSADKIWLEKGYSDELLSKVN